MRGSLRAVARLVPAPLLLSACLATRPADPLTRGTARDLSESRPIAAEEPAAAKAPDPRMDARRTEPLSEAGGAHDLLAEALRSDEYGGSLQAGEAIEAYAAGEEQKALLMAQVALGSDPGNGARRRLLSAIEKNTGMKADPDGILPLEALVHLELQRAEEAFFSELFGAAVQACRRALILSPDSSEAWLRLGSAHYALGDEERARASYLRARELGPGDADLERFLETRGWLPDAR